MRNTIKKQRLFFISLIGIVVVSLAMSATYAYQTLQTNKLEGSDTDMVVNVGNLEVTFKKSTDNINLTNMPLLQDYKTADYVEIEIDNTKSSDNAAYQIALTELDYSTNLASSDFKYTITKVTAEGETVLREDTFERLGTDPLSENIILGTSLETTNYFVINKGNIDKIRLYLWLKETEEVQNGLENTYFKGKINITSIFEGNAPQTLNGGKQITINESMLLDNYRIYGNSIQNGTPTNSSPVEIESVGDKTKNLFNIDNAVNGTILCNNNDGTYNLNYLSVGRFSPAADLYIPANTSFTVSTEILEYTGTNTYSLNLQFILSDGTSQYSALTKNTNVRTHIFESDVVSVKLYQQGSNEVGTYTKFKNLMIEIGNGATNYEPYGYKIPVTVRGKNLINTENSQENYYINSSGNVLSSSAYGVTVTEKIYVKPSTTYVYSGMGNVLGTTVSRTGYQYDASGNPIKIVAASSGSNVKFTTESNCYYVILQYVKTEKTPMLEEGTTATGYESYQRVNTINIYLDEPLRKVENNADYIDFEKGKVVRNISSITYDGSSDEIWASYGQHQVYYAYQIDNTLADKIIAKQCLCNRYETLPGYGKLFYGTSTGCYLGNNNSVNTRFIVSSDKSTVSDFKAEIASNPINVIFKLSNPTEGSINLPKINLNKGTNIFTIDTSVEPSNVELVVSDELY